MSAKLYTLTAGQRTPWIDLRGITAFEFQGTNASSSVAALYGGNLDPTSESATTADEGAIESFSGSFFARSLYSPMSNWVYFKNTAGTGTVKITIGQALNESGQLVQTNELSFAKGTTGRSNEMPS
jgi:hypothetical protein